VGLLARSELYYSWRRKNPHREAAEASEELKPLIPAATEVPSGVGAVDRVAGCVVVGVGFFAAGVGLGESAGGGVVVAGAEFEVSA